MTEYFAAMPHGAIEEVFPDIFFVTGTMRNEFFGSMWQFSRNMTVVREGEQLTIINSVRLNEEGLAALDSLGTVVNVVRIGDMHGVDDPFYLDRYKATFWALPKMRIQDGLSVDKELVVGGEMPISCCSLFVFETSKRPECILHIKKEGGIMIACDSLQNWVEPDEYFTEESIKIMKEMGFFTAAGLGPAWLYESEPQAEDFARLKKVQFKHALCGHGSPLQNSAMEAYHASFERLFEV